MKWKLILICLGICGMAINLSSCSNCSNNGKVEKTCRNGCSCPLEYCPAVQMRFEVDSLAPVKILKLYTANPYDTVRVNWGNGLTDIFVSEPDTLLHRNVVSGRLHYTYRHLGAHTITICGPVEMLDITGIKLLSLKTHRPELRELIYDADIPEDSLQIENKK